MWVDFIADLRGMTIVELTTTNAERILDWSASNERKKNFPSHRGRRSRYYANLKRYFDVRPMRLGSAINGQILSVFSTYMTLHGVIVFTDPDFNGSGFAHDYDSYSTVQHAFLKRWKLFPSQDQGPSLGEHAIWKTWKKALTQVTEQFEHESQFWYQS